MMPTACDVVVVGSVNTDHLVSTSRLPAPGETVLGSRYETAFGGKGANQAVATASLGARVALVAGVGDEENGAHQLWHLATRSVDVSQIEVTAAPTGIAFVAVDDEADNQVVVVPGASLRLSLEFVEAALRELVGSETVVLVSLEIAGDVARVAIDAARSAGGYVVLNPAPFQESARRLLDAVNMVTPNAGESEALLGENLTTAEEWSAAVGRFQQDYPDVELMVTLGESGASWFHGRSTQSFQSPRVVAVDETGAGDAFNGALAAALSDGASTSDAARLACLAGSIVAATIGVQVDAASMEPVARLLETLTVGNGDRPQRDNPIESDKMRSHRTERKLNVNDQG